MNTECLTDLKCQQANAGSCSPFRCSRNTKFCVCSTTKRNRKQWLFESRSFNYCKYSLADLVISEFGCIVIPGFLLIKSISLYPCTDILTLYGEQYCERPQYSIRKSKNLLMPHLQMTTSLRFKVGSSF